MMNNPPVNELQNKVGCRYMLVTAVAKRARQLMADPSVLGDRNTVTVAVEEIFSDKLKIRFPEEGER